MKKNVRAKLNFTLVEPIYLRAQVKCPCGCGGFVVRPPATPKEKRALAKQYVAQIISKDRQRRIGALLATPKWTKFLKKHSTPRKAA